MTDSFVPDGADYVFNNPVAELQRSRRVAYELEDAAVRGSLDALELWHHDRAVRLHQLLHRHVAAAFFLDPDAIQETLAFG